MAPSLPLLSLLRPRQWIKNFFVLAPLLFTGRFTDPTAIATSLLAMALFCLASSITYIINDLCDVEADRRHPTKSRTRPLASGAVTTHQALALLAILAIVLAFAIASQPALLYPIAAYLLLNLAYSFRLKHLPVTDIFTIAIGFLLRVYTGAVALAVPLSPWMFVTTLSIALFLAAIKRRQELLRSNGEGRAVLSHYTPALMERYAEMAGTGSLVFYSLFVLGVRPELVGTIPFVLFGLFRYWYIAEAQEEGESPTDVAWRDRPLILTVLLWALACGWLILTTEG